MMQETKTCDTCREDECSAQAKRTGESAEDFRDRQELARRMCDIRHKIVVLSGKGGVGKSTVAANLAVSLSLAGNKVGLLDVDIHGPSVPRLLGLEGVPVTSNGETIMPLEYAHGLKVMSIGFLLREQDDAVIWRGPMKYGVIKQFLKDVEWGNLDYLIVDSPPGTGDEPLSVCQLMENIRGAMIVTTPQDLALIDVRKSVTFCRQLNVPVLGVVENMSGFVCPKCGERTDIFKRGGAEKMARDMGVPFLGRIPIDPGFVSAGDDGTPYVSRHAGTETAAALAVALQSIVTKECSGTDPKPTNVERIQKEEVNMRIAIPVVEGKLSMHFGHSEQFAIVEADPQTKAILGTVFETPPRHEPGVLPRWLSEKGANVIIAGGMGQRAQSLFAEQNIEVIVGAPSEAPVSVVEKYLAGDLKTGQNICDH